MSRQTLVSPVGIRRWRRNAILALPVPTSALLAKAPCVRRFATTIVCALLCVGTSRVGLAACSWGSGTGTTLSMNGANCNLGINMTSGPAFRLDFGGSNRLAVDPTTSNPDATTLLFGDGTGWKLHFGKRSDSGATKFLTLQDNGNVGIGTTAPVKKLDVRNGQKTVDNGTLLRVGSTDGSPIIMDFALIGSATPTNQGISIDVNEPGVSDDRPLVLQRWGGNVGIGTTTPVALLDVNGSVNVSGNIAAKYQDLAEWVPTTKSLTPGTVVVISADRMNWVSASSKAYDTAVAGVVSAKPGIILGEAGKDKVAVATTGRVRVNVDTTRAPVRIGDLLVSSDREGYAMPSEPIEVAGVKIHRPGTVIGKALEHLPKGQTGKILMLLALQ